MKINIKTVNVIFSLGAVAVLSSHVLLSAGLYDSAWNLMHIILYEKVRTMEISRTIFEQLQSFPALLFVKEFSSSSLSLLIGLYCFGLIWIHIVSLLGCYFILPRNKKNMIFFPLFAFFTGPIPSLHISISVGLAVCSYVWLLAYVIYYSDLSNIIHKTLLFIVPLPLLLSYESMSYMAWPLIALCLHKSKTEKLNKGLLWFVQIYLIIVSLTQIFTTAFHDRLTNRAGDLNSVVREITSLDFLFKPSFNFFVCLSFLILSFCFIWLYKDLIQRKGKIILRFIELPVFLSFILILFACVSQIKNDFIFDYSIRFYPSVIALPFSFFLWWICEKRKVNVKMGGGGGESIFIFQYPFCFYLCFF